MQQSLDLQKKRIESIDILRGMAMVVMALDHVRDYFHIAANLDNPLNLQTTTPLLFFTRWITHYCAPIFVFLSGTSIYLQSLRKTKSQLAAFLIKRGLWLIFAEVVIISFGWSFNPHYNYIFLQVIWVIGISMVILGMLIRFPYRLILTIGLIIVLGHNLLDIPESAPSFKPGFVWDLLHHGSFVQYPYAEKHSLFLVYPFVPWVGLMMLGYCTGILFGPASSAEKRRKMLNYLGIGLVLFFIILRFTNIYGDPHPWQAQKTPLFTFLSFINVNKYPPSLLFMCVTIGPALLLLSLLENVRNGLTATMRIYGRVAFFYYVIHIYLVHLFSSIGFFARGHSFQDVANTGTIYPFYFVVPGEGYNLAVVYAMWLTVVIIMFPLCKWYDNYKSSHRQYWWLSYL